MNKAQAKALSDRNIALQEIVKAVKDCDGVRAIEQCRVAIEWQARFDEANEEISEC